MGNILGFKLKCLRAGNKESEKLSALMQEYNVIATYRAGGEVGVKCFILEPKSCVRTDIVSPRDVNIVVKGD